MSPLAEIAAKYIAPIEEVELACRLLEAAGRLVRPAGLTAIQAFELIDYEDQEAWRRAARAAVEYWRECITNAQSSNQ
jgi:hypothetical protein